MAQRPELTLEPKQRLEQRLTQKMIQAIKMLQLTRLELIQTIRSELEANPVLEEVPAESESQQSLEELMEAREAVPETQSGDPIDWVNYIRKTEESGYARGYDVEEPDEEEYQRPLVKTESLYDHLLWQIGVSALDDETKELCALIVGNLNEDGYLTVSIEEIARQNGVDQEKLLAALKVVQELDPSGVGARDLKECLLIQLRQLGITDSLETKIVEGYLEDVAKGNLKKIAKELDTTEEKVRKAVDHISQLEPKPGRPFSRGELEDVVPDVYVYRVGDDFVIQLNEDGLPKLRISSYYKRLLTDSGSSSPKVKEFLKDKLKSAAWIINMIRQRQRTIYRVTESILKFQRDFFEKGVPYMKPMVLKDVADDIGMHESTISRATRGKWVHTPWGLFEFKFFFNSGLRSSYGDIAAVAVRNRIRQLLANEDINK
ncbi:MAG TPA: RNA polymerase sigma-54 factor, partial [Proteobacteria bacterium]|nr:RNA polymerase sigma-54 factor [Pseudomonadota bacterium]